MTSLCPGTLFSFPGFNRKSTPTPPTVTKDQLSRLYKRESFNGRPWPHSSPTAGVYDIGFTSTKMIIYNNRCKRNSKLRGKNDPSAEEDLYPDPDRHSRSSTPVNRESRTKCYDSSSPHFSPTVKTDIRWINASQRPPFTYEDGRMVNPKHHTSCVVPADPVGFRIGMNTPRRPTSRTSLPAKFQSSPLLTHPDLRKGEKEYLHSIARIYDVSPMIHLKQEQYNQLLSKEMDKGLYTMGEVKQYRQFINLGRKRQYLRPQGNRIMSAPLIKMFEREDRMKVRKQKTQVEDESSGENETGEKKADTTSSPDSDRPGKQTEKNEKTTKSSPDEKKVVKRPGSVRIEKRPVSNRSTKSSSSSRSGKSSQRDEVKRSRSKSPEKKEVKDKSKESDSSDTSESVMSATDWKIHREGFDRPRTRLGHISEDSRSQRSQVGNAQDSSDATKVKETPNDQETSWSAYETTKNDDDNKTKEDHTKTKEDEKDDPLSIPTTDDTKKEEDNSNNGKSTSRSSSSSSKSDDEKEDNAEVKEKEIVGVQKYHSDSDSEDEKDRSEKVNKDPDTLEY